jgi:hypothetical protein
MAQLARVAPNPPKEEGGGDLLHSQLIMRARMLQSNEGGLRFAFDSYTTVFIIKISTI